MSTAREQYIAAGAFLVGGLAGIWLGAMCTVVLWWWLG